jgi:hypothetical protein
MNIRDLLSEDIKRNLIEKMLKIFRNKNGTCTRSDLINYGHLLQRERDEALEALLECGAVEERKVIETGKKILILKNDNKPKIEIDSLAAKFQNLDFSKLSKLSKLSNSAHEQEYSAQNADDLYAGGNMRVSYCLIVENAEFAEDAVKPVFNTRPPTEAPRIVSVNEAFDILVKLGYMGVLKNESSGNVKTDNTPDSVGCY